VGGNRRQFPACDGLRALAAGAVVLFHTTVLTGVAHSSSFGAYFRQLGVGVDVFFVLSGFLLYRPFVRAHLSGGEAPAAGRYLKRRVLRIFPAYWVALAAVFYIFHQAAAQGTADNLTFYGLLQIYSGRHALGGLVPAWSLATEISFYVFLPVYAAFVRRVALPQTDRLHLELAGVGALYVASAVFRIVISIQGFHVGETWLPAYLDVFAVGMLLAVVSVAAERDPSARWLRALPRDAAVWWIGAAALFIVMANIGMPEGLVATTVGRYMTHHLLAGMVGLFLVAPAVLHETAGGTVRRFLAHPVLRSLGLVSYGIFLWHLPWIVQAVRWTGGQPYLAEFWPVLLLSGLLTLLTAWASYALVERPLLGRRRRTATAPATVPVAPAGQPH
jgi:peptidoglycan/LPS O-acetylase OafA/YrhL